LTITCKEGNKSLQLAFQRPRKSKFFSPFRLLKILERYDSWQWV